MTILMEEKRDCYFEGERALFAAHNLLISGTTFGEGESPLKHSSHIKLENSIFKWKYPLWYSHHILMRDSIFETVAHAGVWYTDDVEFDDCAIQASKTFRRSSDIRLKNVHFSDAAETLWSCRKIRLDHVQASGEYFGMNSSDIQADHLNVIGNYAFDGARNIEVHDSTFVTKDAFWNCENVTIYNSTINGEYFGWNSKHVTLVNCTVESDQGFCYIDHLVMRNCRLLRTDLAFEYCSNIDAEVCSRIESVKNPISGQIHADSIGQLIMDPSKIDPTKTKIVTADHSAQAKGAINHV